MAAYGIVFDQGINSVTNLIFLLLAARLLDPITFGRFAIMQGVLLLGQAAIGALVVDVLLRAQPADVANTIGSGARKVASASAGAGGIATLGFALLDGGLIPDLLLALTASVTIAGLDYCRAMRIRRGRIRSAILWDSIFGTMQVIGVLGLGSLSSPSLQDIWLVWTLAATLSVIPLLFSGRGPKPLGAAGEWARVRYSVEVIVVSGSSTLSQLLVVPFLGYEYAGAFRACLLLLSPISFMLVGLKAIVLPYLSEASDIVAMRASRRFSTVLFTATMLLSVSWYFAPVHIVVELVGGSAPGAIRIMLLAGLVTASQSIIMGSFYLARAKHLDSVTLLGRMMQVCGVGVSLGVAIVFRSAVLFLLSQAILFSITGVVQYFHSVHGLTTRQSRLRTSP